MIQSLARNSPPRLVAALWVSIGATLIVAVVAILRTGLVSWIGDIVRPVGLVAFALLSLQGKSWARWMLAALLGVSALVFFANLITAVGQPGLVALLVLMSFLYIWTVFELAWAE